jgi:hypothetical protein
MRAFAVGPPASDERFAAVVPRHEHVLIQGLSALAFGIGMRIWILGLAALVAAESRVVSAQSSPPKLIEQDGRIVVMLGEIDPRRIRSYDSSLVSFGTRNTYSDTISRTRGIGAARRWIHPQLPSFSRDCGGCLRVEYDTGTMQAPRLPGRPMRRVTNVLAWLPGRDTSRVIVIGGHYDSCVCAVPGAGGTDSVSTAPGANDDGSGSSAVIELARVFSRMFSKGLDVTVIFALHDAEEQGLLGSTHLARRLKDGGFKVVAGMTNDIVGNVTAEDGAVDSTSVRIFAPEPDTSRSRELARYVWAVGETYLPNFRVITIWRLDRVNRGGDHRPYIEQGWAGLRFTERIENEKRQHRPTDELAWVNFGYVANVARLNAASIASLGLSPATPDSARAARDVPLTGGRRWTLTWAPVAGVASYEILVRPTTSAQYDRVIPVGSATSYDLDLQLDEAWAGIRAVGTNGQRSLPIVVPRVTRVIPAPDR